MDVPALYTALNDHGFEDTSNARKLETIQSTIWEIEGLKPWPFLETSALLNFDGVSETPSNWATIAAFRASIRVKDLSTGRRVKPMRLEEFEDRVGLNYAQQGNPRLYYFEGNQMKFWPVPPAQTGRMKLRYTRWSDPLNDTSPESAILLPKYFHRGLVLNGALWKLYEGEDDSELAARYEGHQQVALQNAMEALFMRQYDMADHIQVTDPDDWDSDYLY